jgi:hypothetical protein
MSHCRSDREIATLPASPKNRRTSVSRSRIPIVLALFAVALIAAQAAFAKGRDPRAVRIHGVCTQQSTSTLKLSREDRGIEVEFEVDQNRNGVPWRVTLSRNGKQIVSFRATTRAPSGSFEIRRVVAGRLGSNRITAVARSASGERCTADSTRARVAANAGAATPVAGDDTNDDRRHDAADDHGHHSGGHS